MVDGKLKTYRLHTPPFCFGCRDFMNSSTAKRNATFTAHTHIHMYATLLNNELMNKTKKILSGYHADTPITIKAEAFRKADSQSN